MENIKIKNKEGSITKIVPSSTLDKWIKKGFEKVEEVKKEKKNGN